MITKLVLERFKNFEKAEITLGPLTVLIGANATGKSNLREAFRFLHGIGQGYTFAEILGGKSGPSGRLVWDGIRGGPREVAYCQAETFALEVTTAKGTFIIESQKIVGAAKYRIEIAPGYQNNTPRLIQETLYLDDVSMFEARPAQTDPSQINLTLSGEPVNLSQAAQSVIDRPLLPRIARWSEWNLAEKPQIAPSVAMFMWLLLTQMSFLDPVPESLRQPSLKGQSVLGDRGEHLASVLQTICADPQLKQSLVNRVRELTPMDVADFDFSLDEYSDQVRLILVEDDGQRLSANSASDGTLRFLTILAALLSPKPARLHFFEELETGLHPTRIYLLLDFIEKQAERGQLQVIATSHSPQMLRFLNAKSRDHVAVTYRLPDSPTAYIKQLKDFPPEARKVIESSDLAELHDSGWFETVALFMQGEE